MLHETIQPQGWAKPIGYANGMAARGRTVYVGGQIGWNAEQQFETDDFVEQVAQTLRNIVAVIEQAGGRPEHIVTMTWYVTDMAEYKGSLRGIGEVYRAIIGKHFPAMAAMQVMALVEDRAKVEIQAIAVLPD